MAYVGSKVWAGWRTWNRLSCQTSLSLSLSVCLFVCVCMSRLDIPEDEAQYWTRKLDHINTMGIHDEVGTSRDPVDSLHRTDTSASPELWGLATARC